VTFSPLHFTVGWVITMPATPVEVPTQVKLYVCCGGSGSSSLEEEDGNSVGLDEEEGFSGILMPPSGQSTS
jgi:hypothetical protein